MLIDDDQPEGRARAVEVRCRGGRPLAVPPTRERPAGVGTPAQGSRRTARAPGVRSGHACHSLRRPYARRASVRVNVADTTCGEGGGGRRGPPRCGPHHTVGCLTVARLRPPLGWKTSLPTCNPSDDAGPALVQKQAGREGCGNERGEGQKPRRGLDTHTLGVNHTESVCPESGPTCPCVHHQFARLLLRTGPARGAGHRPDCASDWHWHPSPTHRQLPSSPHGQARPGGVRARLGAHFSARSGTAGTGAREGAGVRGPGDRGRPRSLPVPPALWFAGRQRECAGG
jgi:hypothetical protein